jgi:hypothetical protein
MAFRSLFEQREGLMKGLDSRVHINFYASAVSQEREARIAGALREALGDQVTDTHIFALKAVFGFIEFSPPLQVPRTQITDTCASVIGRTDDLCALLDTLRRDVYFLPWNTDDVDDIEVELNAAACALQQAKSATAKVQGWLSSQPSGTIELHPTDKAIFARTCAAIWFDCGRKVATTNERPFANFLNTMHMAVFDWEQKSTTHLAGIAKAFTDSALRADTA